MNLTRTTSSRLSSTQDADFSFNASSTGKLLMWMLLAVAAFCWSLGSLRAGED